MLRSLNAYILNIITLWLSFVKQEARLLQRNRTLLSVILQVLMSIVFINARQLVILLTWPWLSPKSKYFCKLSLIMYASFMSNKLLFITEEWCKLVERAHHDTVSRMSKFVLRSVYVVLYSVYIRSVPMRYIRFVQTVLRPMWRLLRLHWLQRWAQLQ